MKNEPSLWLPPQCGWIKINIDGAVSQVDSNGGCRGALRDYLGSWIAGFSFYLGQCSLEAEAWACLKGLNLAWDMGYKSVILETDCKALIDILESEPDELSPHSQVVLEVSKLLKNNWMVKSNHIPRFRNRVADRLAKEALLVSSFFSTAPSFVKDLVLYDCMGFQSPSLS